MRNTILAAAAAIAALGAAEASAQDKTVTFRVSYWVPQQHPIASKGIHPWGDAIDKASGGTVKFQYFPAGQLGKAEDHYDMVRDGIADAGWINPGFNAGRWPIFATVQLPMLIGDARGGSEALTEWYAPHALKEMSEVKICFAHVMHPLGFHAKRRIVLPDDLKGMKIRPSSAMEALYIRNAGGATVPGTYPEAREMIERGVADGTTGVFGSGIAFGVDKVTKFHLNIPFSVPGWVMAVNKAKYDSLSAGQKKAFDEQCSIISARRMGDALHEFDAAGIVTLKGRNDGREVLDITPDQLKAWQSRMPAVKDAWAKDVAAKGGKPDEIYNGLTAVLRQRKALIE